MSAPIRPRSWAAGSSATSPDQEAGRRDDRVGWSELIREAKETDARRFDAVIVSPLDARLREEQAKAAFDLLSAHERGLPD